MRGNEWAKRKALGTEMLAYLSKKNDGERGFAYEKAGNHLQDKCLFSWGPHAQP
jgi:hypothetical protein